MFEMNQAPSSIGEIVGTGEGFGKRRNAMDTAAWLAINSSDSTNGGFGIGFGQDYSYEIGVPAAISKARAFKIDPVYGDAPPLLEAQ